MGTVASELSEAHQGRTHSHHIAQPARPHAHVHQEDTRARQVEDARFTLATGARQLVVHEALDTTVMSGVYLSWLTPITNMGASPEGAEMITFLAPPESRQGVLGGEGVTNSRASLAVPSSSWGERHQQASRERPPFRRRALRPRKTLQRCS